jgi:tellurite resistance protein TehA-like permease
MIALSGWRGAMVVVTALVVLALLLTALFWLGVLLAALAAVAWFNLFLLPSLSARSRIPEWILALVLLPMVAAAGLVLGGSGGLVAGCVLWILGVALPRTVRWRLRRRLERGIVSHRHLPTVIDARFTSNHPG